MPKSKLLLQIARSKAGVAQVAARVARQPELLNEILAGLGEPEARLKYGCSKVLRLISEAKPAVLYPHFDAFVALLGSENTIHQWEAIRILANLASVDTGRKLAKVLSRYLQPIRGPVMITAANVIRSAARIAQARPELANRIAKAILRVEQANYQTAECRNVVIGHAILALGEFYEGIAVRAAATQFVRRQLANPRPATRRKAGAFLQKHDRPAAR